ncbi:MAG: thiamine pyrophosphate-binding protein [SAR202 cluster bacterium]|nr:thiamine pyrophosphate-binding protein [SAR202 cluster bacterium]
MPKIEGAALVSKSLQREGTKHIYSVPGGPIGEILASGTHYGIRPIGMRHEQAAVFASIGEAYVSNTVGVSTLAGGPGVTNGVTGAHVAWDNSIPIVILGGSYPLRGHMSGTFQETDNIPMYKSITKLAIKVETPERIPEYMAMAFRKARSGRPGPVYLDLPSDVLSAEVDEEGVRWPALQSAPRPAGDPNAIKRAAEVLLRAERPMMILGKGVRWSEPVMELRTLVESLGIPFVPSPMGRGFIPDDHPLNMNAARNAVMSNCDAVLIVGARMNWMFDAGRRSGARGVTTPPFPPTAKVIQIDIEAEEIGTNRTVDVGIVGDAKVVLQQLLAELEGKTGGMAERAEEGPWLTALRQEAKKNGVAVDSVMNSDARPIHTHRLLKEVRDVFPRDTIYTVDGATTLNAGRQVLQSYTPASRLNCGSNGCIGVGVPFAVGAKLARPNVPVVSVNGDCAFGYNGMEVGTAAQYKLPIVFIINNNAGIVGSSFQSRMELAPGYNDYISTYDPAFRYDLTASIFGGHSENVTEPADIRSAIQRAYDATKRGQVAVVNVMSDPKDMGTMRGAQASGRASALLGYG